MLTAGFGASIVKKTVIWPLIPEEEVVELPKAWLALIRPCQLGDPTRPPAPNRTVLAAPSAYNDVALGSPCGMKALALYPIVNCQP